uniref:CCHC-type domain-containing protein n=1 Tax=Tanacetum cinerariifolium TaxID=118510 RepID=A0A6L2JU69_TANCI|nr:hypothetical protein [Tanacetum cinerariifolium]
MEKDDTIDSFNMKMTSITSKMTSLGSTLDESTHVQKLLNSVLERFIKIIASIEQYFDLDKMTLDEAIGRLKTFEERIKVKKGRAFEDQDKLLFAKHNDNGRRHHYDNQEEEDTFNHISKIMTIIDNMEKKKISHKITMKQQKSLEILAKFQRKDETNLIEEELEPTLLMASTSFNKTQRKSSKNTPTNKSIWFAKDNDENSKFGEIILNEVEGERDQEHQTKVNYDKLIFPTMSLPLIPSSSKLIKPPARPGFGTVGRKVMITANHFLLQLGDKNPHQYVVAVKFAATKDIDHLRQFLSGRQHDNPQETIQALDIVLRKAASLNETLSSRQEASDERPWMDGTLGWRACLDKDWMEGTALTTRVVPGALASGPLLMGFLLFVALFYAQDKDGWHVNAISTSPTELCFNKLTPSVEHVIQSTKVKNDGLDIVVLPAMGRCGAVPTGIVSCGIGSFGAVPTGKYYYICHPFHLLRTHCSVHLLPGHSSIPGSSDVIESGNSFVSVSQTTTVKDGAITTTISSPVTAKEKTRKKNDVKARSMLLMALPNEHLMTFTQYKDAKSLFAAIETRFGRSQFKFFESLPSEWNTQVVVWRNKSDLDTMSIDDLYNNFKIVKQEVRGTTSSNLSSQNMAFVSSSSTNNTNEVHTAYGVSTAGTQPSTASTQVNIASTQTSTANLSDATVYAFLANQLNGLQLVNEDLEQIHEDDLEEVDLKWQLALLSIMANRFFQKTKKKITINGSDTVGFDKSKVECYNCHKMRHFARECRGPKNQDGRNMYQNNSRRTVHVEKTHPKDMVAIDGVGFDWSYMAEDEAPANMALMAFLNSETGKGVCKDISNKIEEYPDAPLVKDRVSDNKDCSVGSPVVVETKVLLTAITMKGKGRYQGIIIQRPRPVNTDRPRSVNTARPNSAVVNTVRVNKVNVVKASTCWVWRPSKPNDASIALKRYNYIDVQEDQGYVNSGCSKHMTRNMSYLSNFKKFDEGYVTFGGGAKRRKNYCVSQICDKKNSVLFTDTGCFVLYLDFKLIDESQVLLKVPRSNNMYSVDMKNIVPKEILTCLVAKATLDESMLWHMRLGHINFEDINKLVKNRALVVKPHNKTPYELFRGRTPALSFMRPFGCHVTILNTLDHLGKFDRKYNDGFFVGNSLNIKSFRVYNLRTRKVEENLHIRFLEDKPSITGNDPEWLFDINVLTKSMNYVPVVACTNSNDFVGTEESISGGHPGKEKGSNQDYILMLLWKVGSVFDSSSKNASNDEPQSSSDARQKYDEVSDKENGATNELNSTFKNLSTEYTDDPNMPGLKTIATNDDFEKDADFTNLESLIQMDVKSAFLYERIKEEVYVCQPTWFEDPDHPDKVYKVVKALYGLQVKPKEDGIFISQDKYVAEVLRKFNFLDVKSASTPVDIEKTLVKDANGDDVDVHLYRSMIKSLMYLTASRPDIIQVEGMLKHKDIYVTPFHTKKIFANMKRQGKDFSGKVKPLFETMMVQPQEDIDEHVTTTFNDPLPSCEDGLKLTELMDLCTQLQSRVLALENTKADQALEIGSLKRRVKKLEKKASKKMIADLDADEGVALVDETQRRNDQDMFDTSIFNDEEVVAEKEVSTADLVTTAREVVTTAGVETSKPKAKRIMMKEPSKTPTPTLLYSSQQPLKATDKGKAKMIEPKKPLKKKDQIMIDEELAARLQKEERGELSIEEKSRMFVELMDKRKKHFARLRAEKIRKLVKGNEKAVEGSEKAEEGSSKRASDKLEQEVTKRQRIEEENESEELKRCLEIISEDDDDVTIEATPLSFKSLTIVDYKIYKEGREDLEVLWSIVKARFKKTKPNMVYYLLVEKMYPFTRNILHQMWNDVRLQVDYEVKMAYDLLRLIRRQINEGYVPE